MEKTIKMGPPSNSTQFDKMYNSVLHWVWSDIRIPKELKELVATKNPQTSLELGCGLGRFSSYLASQGIEATGIDFSNVAIEKAKQRVEKNELKPTFLTGDVTDLKMLKNTFDISLDVGCFHCLDKESEKKYVNELYRLLKPGATHLLWTLEFSPSEIKMNPEYIREVFGEKFQVWNLKFSRRRIIASYWYWLIRE